MSDHLIPLAAFCFDVKPDDSSSRTQWSFVIQFRSRPDARQGQFDGRIEHVLSGEAHQFRSIEEFIRLLAEMPTSSAKYMEL